jgi:hypothetical protein
MQFGKLLVCRYLVLDRLGAGGVSGGLARLRRGARAASGRDGSGQRAYKRCSAVAWHVGAAGSALLLAFSGMSGLVLAGTHQGRSAHTAGAEVVEEAAVVQAGDVRGGGDGQVCVEDRVECRLHLGDWQPLELDETGPVGAVDRFVVEQRAITPGIHQRRSVGSVEDQLGADDRFVPDRGM